MLCTCQDMSYLCHINSSVRSAVGQVKYPLCVCVRRAGAAGGHFLTVSACVWRFMRPCTSSPLSLILTLGFCLCLSPDGYPFHQDPSAQPQASLCIVYDPQNIFVLLFLEPQFFYCLPTVNPLSLVPTLTLKRNFLACLGTIEACVGRIALAVWLDFEFKLGTFLAIH